MRRPLALVAATVAIILALGLLPAPSAHADGLGEYLKFFFTPQAGLSSICLSCGWHSGACVGPTPPPGPALDFPASCSDAGYDVYFRAFGLKPSGGDEWVAYGTPFTVPGALCMQSEVRIRDKDNYNNLGWMRYTHTYKTRDADMLMYVSQSARLNQYVVAGMAHEPDHPENSDCVTAGYWGGPHVHEYDADGTDTIFLRDGGDCTQGDKYPCAPASGGPYYPQNWWSDWARVFCIDDTDCDGWTDSQESYVGTDSWDACPDSTGDAAWPLDINNDRVINLGFDVAPYAGRIGATPGSAKWWQRLDLNADGLINLGGDVMLYRNRIGSACTN
jgi:hypothetical protein